MKLTYRPLANEEVLRVFCEGHVSTRGTPPGSEPLLELLGPHCYRQKVILNLERTDGVDTSGLMWLVRVATKFGGGGGRMAVYNYSPNFRNMLEVLGMSGTVNLMTTEQGAVEAVTRTDAPVPPGDNGAPRDRPRAFPGPRSDAG
jgi:anti-anti-sigma regulatory factor